MERRLLLAILLTFVVLNAEHRRTAEAQFRRLVPSVEHRGAVAAPAPFGTVEILEFCMRALRWEGVRADLHAVVRAHPGDGHNWEVRKAALRILDAYEGVWDNADLYRLYRP